MMAEVTTEARGDDKTDLKVDNGNRESSKSRKRKTRAQRYKEKQPRVDYEPIVKDNVSLVKYYKQQSIFKPEEFDDFMAGLRETLPASFRINTFDLGQAQFLRHFVQGRNLYEFLNDDLPNVENQTKDADGEVNGSDIDGDQKIDGTVVEEGSDASKLDESNKLAVLQALSWYPQKYAWQMNITRLDLRKSPILKQFQKFLMAETDNGYISRQEAVSMIPPLLLDVHRGQNVLDMCAAPGSKTAQLLEYLKHDITGSAKNGNAKEMAENTLFDDGMVVANDVDNKRCYMLVHQSNRLNSPNCIIINQDAARLPDMKTFANDGDEYKNLKFDRILCDVPCSGDGTVRKNPDVWKKWTVGNANNFHGMQVKILRRGIELLNEGGLLVYSTCSMNPVEDEAVIASVLRASQGTVVLEDIAHKLPGLKYKPGTSKWVVMNREVEIIESVDKVPPENATQIYPSLFQPTEEESAKFNLHNCIRILPHLQNTGGFFVAVLKKIASKLPWEEQNKKPIQTETSVDGDKEVVKPKPQPTNPKKRRYGGFREDPFFFMDAEDSDWISIRNGYGISDKFPVNQLVHRCVAGKKRSIYLVSKRTRSFIIANREEPDKKEFVKIINGGMRLFSRADTESGFRICQDGVTEVLPYIKDEMKVQINKEDLIALLKTRAVGFDNLSASQQIKDTIKPGSFILIYKNGPTETGAETTGQDENDWNGSVEISLVAWKGEVTVALYVSNTFRVHLCALAQLKIGDDGGATKQSTTKQETVQQ